MGRPKLKNRESIRNLGFSYKPEGIYRTDDDTEIIGKQLVEEIDQIADRERIPRSELIMKALANYHNKHFKGNSQTLLPSFGEGGIKSQGQIANDLLHSFEGEKDVEFRKVLAKVRSIGIVKRWEIEVAEAVVKELREKGVRIWR